jgi:hypothetical protein
MSACLLNRLLPPACALCCSTFPRFRERKCERNTLASSPTKIRIAVPSARRSKRERERERETMYARNLRLFRAGEGSESNAKR